MSSMRFDRAQAPSRAYESIAERIRDAIYAGEIRPGDRLPAERELMEQFGVGRTTIREALRVLEAGGLVRTRQGDPRGGAHIQAFSPGILRSSLMSLIHMEGVRDAQLIEFRMIIEAAACYLGAIFRSPERLEELERIHQEVSAHAEAGDHEEFRQADAAFHRVLALCSENPIVEAFGEVVHEIVLALMGQKLDLAADKDALMRETAERHAQILQALKDQDALLAAGLAVRDIYDYYREQVDAASSDRIAAAFTHLTWAPPAQDGLPDDHPT